MRSFDSGSGCRIYTVSQSNEITYFRHISYTGLCGTLVPATDCSLMGPCNIYIDYMDENNKERKIKLGGVVVFSPAKANSPIRFTAGVEERLK